MALLTVHLISREVTQTHRDSIIIRSVSQVFTAGIQIQKMNLPGILDLMIFSMDFIQIQMVIERITNISRKKISL